MAIYLHSALQIRQTAAKAGSPFVIYPFAMLKAQKNNDMHCHPRDDSDMPDNIPLTDLRKPYRHFGVNRQILEMTG